MAGTSGIETVSRGVDLLGRNPIRTQVLKFSTDPKEKLDKVTQRQLRIVGNTTLHPHYQSQAPNCSKNYSHRMALPGNDF